MNILLSSVGRRPYLVRWFIEALKENSAAGKVIAADIDAYSPSRSFADYFILAPRVDSKEYLPWLHEVLDIHEIDMAISVNDFELSVWANLPFEEDWLPLVRLTPDIQGMVEDKYMMGKVLEKHGIRTPQTWLGENVEDASKHSGNRYVTKGRFGSASRGLQFVQKKELEAAIGRAIHNVTDREGISALNQRKYSPENLVIVQERIEGIEYGLDIVSDMDKNFAGVLAREKLAMRAGETDRAISVPAEGFEDLAERIAKAVPHQGTIDVDVLVNEEGEQYVIDVNPRFGGGYPFSHLAGARVPSAYIAWRMEKSLGPEWLRTKEDVVGGKYVEAVEIL